MPDLPDYVDLNWIARQIVELRNEIRTLRDLPD